MPDAALTAQHLVELLADVSSCDDEDSAIRAAVERAAETVEAEVCGLLVGPTVVDAVGLPEGSPEYARLAEVPRGRGELELPGLGRCGAGWARLGRADEGVLVLARAGAPFSVAEHNLIRGMARVLGLTLRMLRTLAAERRRERFMRHLYDIQRLITRHAPLAEILRETLAAGGDVLGDVTLSLVDARTSGQAMIASVGQGGLAWERRALADDDLTADAISTGHVQQRADAVAAPVHEQGHVVGALTARVDSGFRDDLLSFAEHISLALTDAKNAKDMVAARHDALTGLPGRALFAEQLRDRLAEAPGAVALLFIDLDRFKAVNDSLGHAAGDVLLTELSHRLRAIVRHGDLIGRLGGDEFAVVLCPAGEHHAREVAARIIDEMSRPVLVPGGVAEVGASIGIALNSPAPAGSPGAASNPVAAGNPVAVEDQDLVALADIAMYEAKRGGRGRYVLARPETADTLQMLKAPSLTR